MPEHLAEQLFTGNPIRHEGYGLIAGGQDAAKWAQFRGQAVLGTATESPETWRNAPDFEGIGTVWVGDTLWVSALQQVRSPEHLGEIYHHLIIARQAASDLGGDLRPLLGHFRRFGSHAEVRELSQRKPILPPLRFSSADQQQVLLASYHALSGWFVGRENALPSLLASIFDGQGPVWIQGLPQNTDERLAFMMALTALMPPPLRAAATFATRIVSTETCHAHFRFLWGNYQYPPANSRVYDWETGRLDFTVPPIPYFDQALAAYSHGEADFMRFMARWQGRTAELYAYFMGPASTTPPSFVQSAYKILLALGEWIDYDAKPTAVAILRLLDRDKSLTPPDVLKGYQEAISLLVREYNRESPPSLDMITSSGKRLADPAFAEIALNILQRAANQHDEAIFELCRAWLDIPAAKPVVRSGEWSKVALSAAIRHLNALHQTSNRERAYQFFNRLYRENIENTGFRLDNQTALELLGVQESAISRFGGAPEDVLETFRLSVLSRNVEALNNVLDAGWQRALPPDLAAALYPASSPADLSQAIARHFPQQLGNGLFPKLALLCVYRKYFAPLLTENVLKMLMVKSRVGQPIDMCYTAVVLDVEQANGAILHALADLLLSQQAKLNSEVKWYLIAWLINNRDDRAIAALRGVIVQPQDLQRSIERLLGFAPQDRSIYCANLWYIFSRARPADLNTAPETRADFALLTRLPYQDWLHVPGAVAQLAAALSPWNTPLNALDRAIEDSKRRPDLERWFAELAKSHADKPYVLENTQRVFGYHLRVIQKALKVEKNENPDLEAAAQRTAFLLRSFSEVPAMQEWITDNVAIIMVEANLRGRSAKQFFRIIDQYEFIDFSQRLEERSLRRLVTPELSPTQFINQLAITMDTLNQLVLWQEEFGQNPEMVTRILNEWFGQGVAPLPNDAKLPQFFSQKGYDETMQALRELIEAGEGELQRGILQRRSPLELLVTGEKKPGSIFGLLLQWVNRIGRGG